jgi:toxin ParE1/3/4
MANICIFTSPASRDLENILDYLAEQSSLNKAEEFSLKYHCKIR